MGADHCAVDQLKLVRGNPGAVQRVQDVFLQSRKAPATELAADRRPLAEPFRKIPPWRARSGDPENAIQNKTMIGWLAPIRVPDSTNEALEEGPLIVGYQIACQAHLLCSDELESQGADPGNHFVNTT